MSDPAGGPPWRWWEWVALGLFAALVFAWALFGPLPVDGP
jgi:hypothetical protein